MIAAATLRRTQPHEMGADRGNGDGMSKGRDSKQRNAVRWKTVAQRAMARTRNTTGEGAARPPTKQAQGKRQENVEKIVNITWEPDKLGQS